MDPFTHILLTRKLVSDKLAVVIAGGIAPDIPFFLTYPWWVIAQGKVHRGLVTNEWPDPPRWMQIPHHAFHSFPIVLAITAAVRALRGQWPRQALWAWCLHIVVDIPTHSRRKFGPHFLWPLSNLAVDSVPWAEVALLPFRKIIKHLQ